jgi:hypothetical protein
MIGWISDLPADRRLRAHYRRSRAKLGLPIADVHYVSHSAFWKTTR